LKRRALKVLLEKSDGKRTLGRLRSRWKVNIKMYVKGIEWERVD
jgi:hypothetical protein